MEGSCLCGSVTVSAPTETEIGVCHCSTCRRWGGGPLLAIHCASGAEFSGQQRPVTYRSSEWAERGFCPTCGTHLFYHLLPTGEYILPAGLFEDQNFEVTNQIFIDEKPGYYDLANETTKLTGEQVFAQFAEAQSGA